MNDLQLGDEQHVLVRRYFAGDFGEVYRQVLLEGPREVGKVEMLAYIALYVEPDRAKAVRFIPVTEDAPSCDDAVAKLQTLSVSGDTRNRHTRFLWLSDKASAMAEDVAVGLAERMLNGLDLPLVLVTWLRLFSSGQTKIVLWYPQLAPASELLTMLKRTAASVFPP